MDYRLTPEQFQHALTQMKFYRSGWGEHLAYAGLTTLIALRLTWPLGWISRYQASLRTVLRLK
jgi:hypothetical protein